MKPRRADRQWPGAVPPPGDDVAPAPAQVTEEPPFDRFCDLVFTGGVASGVVYPWAIVELARAFRFKNIGGTSVGAMAAALAAAAEYGRRHGHDAAFEVLRLAPAKLGQPGADGRTTHMLSLFQPSPAGRRLMQLWARLGRGQTSAQVQAGDAATTTPGGLLKQALFELPRIYAVPLVRGAVFGFGAVKLVSYLCGFPLWPTRPLELALMALGALALAVCELCRGIRRDIRDGVIRHHYGLCKGARVTAPNGADPGEGLTDWLHEGVQRSAGLRPGDAPLTFRDLWCAPAFPGAPVQRCCAEGAPARRSINLQMITSNLTHRRPYRLPLDDTNNKLYFCPVELEGYFPPTVLAALVKASRPYEPAKRTVDHDPQGRPYEPPDAGPMAGRLRELPGADMPIVVAARLSLSFPLLLSAVPLWAVDYEAPPGQRALRRCWFTDGGVSSNFPIHLFDAAVPRWPTFGFWLDRHPPYCYGHENDVWLPKYANQGRGDNWDRFDPGSRPGRQAGAAGATSAGGGPAPGGGTSPPAGFDALGGFLLSLIGTAIDWRDRTSFQLPHVRNRVVRLMLRAGEGGLNIAMPREQILRMAHRYGTKAGLAFVQAYAPEHGQPSRRWREQRWIRLNLLVNSLRERLDGLAEAVRWPAHAMPMDAALSSARHGAADPVEDEGHQYRVEPSQVDALSTLIQALEALEDTLQAAPPAYRGVPEPELRLRPPL